MTGYLAALLVAGSVTAAAAPGLDTSGFHRTREVCNARGYHLPPLTPAAVQWLRARQAEGVDVSRARVETLIGRYGEALFCWYVDSQHSR